MTPEESRTRYSIRRHLAVGIALVILLAGGVGGWAATTELAGAVLAQGHLVVETNVKKVQHPTGGVVAELRVRDGGHVQAGDVLVRLDDTQIRAGLMIVTKALDELDARQARGEAEREGTEAVDFPPELLARSRLPDVARLIEGERRFFEIRRTTREGQKAQLRERMAQIQQEIAGLEAQGLAKTGEIEWVGRELDGVRTLWEKNLIQFNRVAALERERSRLTGERGQLSSAVAQGTGKIAETQLQILQIDQDLRSEVGRDLAEIRAKRSELIERRVAAEDQLMRVELRAPQDGFVHQLTVHTVGGVIIPNSEPVMLIVPAADQLTVEAKIQPQDIDQLYAGQQAGLRFSAFNQRTTPEISGEIAMIAADVTQEARTGNSYYVVRIAVLQKETARLGSVKLVPGMPVEVFVQTKPRTAASYLLRPLHDQLQRAFKES